MSRKSRKRSRKEQPEQNQGSVTGVLEKAAEVGSSLPLHPVRAWESAEEGTQELGDVLPDMAGLHGVKSFIQRHPVASTCVALAVGYMVFRSTLPMLGRLLRR